MLRLGALLVLAVVQCDCDRGPRQAASMESRTPAAAAIPVSSGADPGADAGGAVENAGAQARTRTAAERALALALAGDDGGVFWLPAPNEERTGILSDDVLLLPEGAFITHIHERPGVAGRWRLSGDTLLFDFGGGTKNLAITSVRVRKRELQGLVDGRPVVLRRADP
ncbi:MAG: hypothetical protein ACRENE_10250 [Polyangiaceae bacterium]